MIKRLVPFIAAILLAACSQNTNTESSKSADSANASIASASVKDVDMARQMPPGPVPNTIMTEA